MPYLIPDVIDPPTRVCIPISVPNDPHHLQVFWGHLGLLGKWYSWERDDAHTGKDVAAVWGQTWIEARNSWALGGCMAIYNLRQTGILLERQNEAGGLWSTLYDPSAQVLIKVPSTLYQNTAMSRANVPGLRLNAYPEAKAGTNDATLIVAAGWGAPAAIFGRYDNFAPYTATIQLEHNVSGGVTPGLDYLRATDTVGNKFAGINAYGNQLLRVVSALPTPTANHYGSIVFLQSGFQPDCGVWVCVYDAYAAEYVWTMQKGADGANGTNGTNGTNGHGYESLDPALQEVLNPNQPPEVVLDNALPTKTFVGFKLPRAQKIASMSAHALAPGATPTAEFSENPVGDSIVDFGIPSGAPGSSYGFDDVLPGLGDYKNYSFLVPGDTLFNLPFRVPAGSVISDINGRGYWTVQLTGNTVVTGSAGYFIGSDQQGQLNIGKKSDQYTGYFTYENAVGEHVFTEDTWVSFAQFRGASALYGGGWMWVSFRLSRPINDTIDLTYGYGATGPSSITDGDEFDFVLGDQGGGFWNGSVTFSVGVNLELISESGWSQGPYPTAVWAFNYPNGSTGGVFPAPLDVPGVAAGLYGANSGSACTIRLKATKA